MTSPAQQARDQIAALTSENGMYSDLREYYQDEIADLNLEPAEQTALLGALMYAAHVNAETLAEKSRIEHYSVKNLVFRTAFGGRSDMLHPVEYTYQDGRTIKAVIAIKIMDVSK